MMRKLVRTSSKESQKNDKIDVEPFLLSSETEDEPCEFEVIFIYNNELYRYGFEVNAEKIISEWLYYRPYKKELEIFYRDEYEFNYHQRRFPKGSILKKGDLVRENALLISVAAQFNDEIAGNVINWFTDLRVISGIREEGYKGFTMSQLEDKNSKKKVLEMIQAADLGIRDIDIKKIDLNNLPEDMPNDLKKIITDKINNEDAVILADTITLHDKFNEFHEKIGDVKFSMEKDESHGTQKFYYLSGPILEVIEKGLILVIDELDSRLHTNLLIKIISIFSNPNIQEEQAHHASFLRLCK